MRKITKIKRSIRAISPVISVLLMIAIAVVASLFAYAWVMGYIGGTTTKAGNAIQLQSFTSQGNLVIYVQNTGQGLVHLKQDGSVYVNDVLKNIFRSDGQDVGAGALIPINVGQTVALTIDYQPTPNEQLRIKIVTVEGTIMQVTGNSGNSGSLGTASVTFSAGTGGTVSPSGTISGISVGIVYQLNAYPNNDYIFSSWTFSGPIQINNPTATQTTMQVTGAGTGTVTGNFIPASNPRLAFTAGAGQSNKFVNEMSDTITIQRQEASGNPVITNSLNVNLATTSSTGTFYSDSAGTNPITSNSIIISSGASSANVWYKDSSAGTPKLTASASGYSPISTTFTINSPTPTPTPTSSPTPTPTPTPTVVLNSSFDGSGTSWQNGWDNWANPPWSVATDYYYSAPQSVKATSSNEGPFSCNPIDATGAKYITVTFWFRINQYTNPTDFQARYGGTVTNNYGSVQWNYLGADGSTLGDTATYSPNVWHQYTVTITDTSVFTTDFRISFLSQSLSSRAAIWVDNVVITVYK